jgi:hypothetical protein
MHLTQNLTQEAIAELQSGHCCEICEPTHSNPRAKIYTVRPKAPMSESVYIETSILGYLTARPSRDLVVTANIEVTREWWDTRRDNFKLYSSQAVVKETSQGDTDIAAQRLKIIRDLELLTLTQTVLDLAEQFLGRSNLPAKADVDAVHIAAATIHSMDYLLTWNCKHIANAQIQRKLAEISLDFGYQLPILCTPYELLGD